MKVAYDHQIFSGQQYGGISRYFCELADRIALLADCDVKVLAPFYVNEYAQQLRQAQLLGIRIPMQRMRRVRERLNAAAVKAILKHNPPDILHETYYADCRVAPKRARVVVTVHDMIYEKLPELTAPDEEVRSLKARAIQQCDHVICVSENTKKDVVELFSIPAGDISVVYHGCSFMPNGLRSTNNVLPKPFLLYVGVRSRYKNFERLLDAYGGSAHLTSDFDLRCFGGPPFTSSELLQMQRLGIASKVSRAVGSDSVLRDMYRSAACLVYPSIYEGFGMPVIEAMSCECPVVCSNTGSLPEVAQDAAEYCCPTEPDNIKAAIERVVYSADRSHLLVQRGKRRAAQFSWDRCAQQTFAVYSSLL